MFGFNDSSHSSYAIMWAIRKDFNSIEDFLKREQGWDLRKLIVSSRASIQLRKLVQFFATEKTPFNWIFNPSNYGLNFCSWHEKAPCNWKFGRASIIVSRYW